MPGYVGVTSAPGPGGPKDAGPPEQGGRPEPGPDTLWELSRLGNMRPKRREAYLAMVLHSE